MSKQINEKLVQFTGKVAIDPSKEYETGEDITMVIKGGIYNIVLDDQHDGTDDKIYKVKVIEAQIA